MAGPISAELPLIFGETRFLTDSDWQQHVRRSVVSGHAEAVILVTDGCQRVVNEAEGATELAALLTADKLVNHSDDDKTILILRSDGHATLRPERDGGCAGRRDRTGR